MRIGIVVPTFPTGVTSSELWLAYGLARRGHEVVVFATGRTATRDRAWARAPGAPAELELPFRIRRISSLSLGYAEGTIPLRLSEVLGETLDVCLLQEDYPPLCQLVGRAARRSGVPYIVTCERYGDLEPGFPRAVMAVMERTTLPRLWRDSAALTFHSRASQNFFLGKGAPRSSMHFVPSCTKCDMFTPGDGATVPEVETLWPTDSSIVRVLTVARLHPAKGLDILAEAFARARAAAPGLRALIHGRGPAERTLREAIARLGLAEVVSLDRSSFALPTLPSLYRSADIYVQPSRAEPFGMAALEAMACGLPVIASATGGLADLVEDGGNGILVPPGDPAALGLAIARLAADPDLRRRMGDASRARAASSFELATVAQAYEDLMRSAVARAG
ncbi:MAG TPA: glycosyltransferase family 4 protein [Thermoplasmata archaeon]|nr:glycosyltransferase family 4 protein [Thermoplasmata archaeon]